MPSDSHSALGTHTGFPKQSNQGQAPRGQLDKHKPWHTGWPKELVGLGSHTKQTFLNLKVLGSVPVAGTLFTGRGLKEKGPCLVGGFLQGHLSPKALPSLPNFSRALRPRTPGCGSDHCHVHHLYHGHRHCPHHYVLHHEDEAFFPR